MHINDYIIEQAGKDWASLLRHWTPPLPTSFTLWLVNRFGDAFVVDDDGDGAVYMLDVGVGTFNRIANNRDRFAELLDVGENANDWLLVSLVDRCEKSDLRLATNECFGLKIPPVFGGKYEITNVVPVNLGAHYKVLADVYNQTKDLPDRTRTKTIVIE